MSKNFVSLTQSAYNEMSQIISSNQAVGIRILCKAGGCAGYKYDMNIVHHPVQTDKEVIYKDLKLYIDKASILKVVGSTIDYNESDFHEGFSFSNESHKSACGCGKSFS